MPVLFTLSNGSTEKSLAAWGIEHPRLVKRSFAADELQFTVARPDITAASLFAYGATLTLKKAGVIVFIGTVAEVSSEATGRGEAETYTAYNGWWNLERIVYQQNRCIEDVVGDTFQGTKSTLLTSRVVLGQEDRGGRYTSTTAMMQAVLSYAFLKGSGLIGGIVIGGVPFPMEEARDITCAEAIRRLAAYTPDAVSWVAYTSGAPIIHIRRRSALTPVELDFAADPPVIVAINGLRPRSDLVPPGVRFVFVQSSQDDADARVKTTVTEQNSGLPNLPGGIVATIDLMGEGTDRPETVPIGAASAYYLALQTVQWEGRIVTGGQDVLGTVAIGNLLNIANGKTAWATMAAMVQGTTEELATGLTTIEVGPPQRLGARDFVDQLMFNRRPRLPTNYFATRNCRKDGPDIDDNGEVDDTGGDEDDNDLGGLAPAAYTDEQRLNSSADSLAQNQTGSTVTLTQCEDGVEVDYRVVGARLG